MAMSLNLIEIDGSYGEAGGQIIRTAIGLSAVTGKSCKIFNIRAGRCNPGLHAQHLKGIQAAAKISSGKLENDRIGSTHVEFYPSKISGGNYFIDVGTAGAITLVLQTLMIPSIHAEREINFEIGGGTDVKWAPTMHYFQHIFCDFLKRIGIDIDVEILKHGFFPKGGGKVKVKIVPNKLKRINFLERGKFEGFECWSVASENLKKAKVGERQIDGIKKVFPDLENTHINYVNTSCPGSSVHIHANYENCRLGSSFIGERGNPAERVGEETARNLMKQINSNACLDEHMADQILPFLALSEGGVSIAEITPHCLTNIWVIEKFLPVKFKVKGESGKPGLISI